MPLAIAREVFITAAVTGAGNTQERSPHVPRSPRQIAASALDAATAGAAIVHCHVRDPETGAPSRNIEYYREVTDRIRAADVDVVLNLTTGMGGDMIFGSPEQPLPPHPRTDMVGAGERMAPIAECLPEICTLDCGSMNYAEADYVMTNTPGMLRAMAAMMRDLRVKPEIEAFDSGHLWFAKRLVDEGIVQPPPLLQLCMGVPWGAPDDLHTYLAMVKQRAAGLGVLGLCAGPQRKCPTSPPPCSPAATCASAWKTICTSPGAYWRPTHSSWSAPSPSSSAWGATVIGPEQGRRRLQLTKRTPR